MFLSLAYIPVDDLPDVFRELKHDVPEELLPIYDYLIRVLYNWSSRKRQGEGCTTKISTKALESIYINTGQHLS